MKKGIYFMVFIFTYTNSYEIFYMDKTNSCSSDKVEINIGALSKNSSGILRNSMDNSFKLGMNCSIFLRPPLSYTLVVSIRSIDLLPAVEYYENCQNYIELSPTKHHKSIKLCGHSYDELEFQSYTHWNGMRVTFITSNVTRQRKAAFQLTFTAVRKDDKICYKGETRCRNQFCIWKGLTCDGHNNCGDDSDELDRYVAHCRKMSSGESLAVILVAVVGSLILIVCSAYLRRQKITHQIERLSQPTPTSTNPTIQSEINPAVGVVPTISRSNYGSISDLLSSCGITNMAYDDPPPRYEDIQNPQLSIPVTFTRPPTSTNVLAVQAQSSEPQNNTRSQNISASSILSQGS